MDGKAGPIFIGGLSHSGKSELRLLLGSHPHLSLTRRTYLWDRFYGRFGDLRSRSHFERCLSAMLRDDGVGSLCPDPARIRREFYQGPATYARLFGLFHAHHAEHVGKRRWGEQLGFVERFAVQIFEAFPSARMIQMIRDPRDRLAVGRSERLRPGSVGWETARWLRSANLAEANRSRYQGRYRVVRYEMLAADPETTVRKLCAFLSEDFDEGVAETLATLSFDKPAAENSRSPRNGRPAALNVVFIDRHARRRLTTLGYAPTATTLSPREQISYAFFHRPLNRATMAASWVLGGCRSPGWIGG